LRVCSVGRLSAVLCTTAGIILFQSLSGWSLASDVRHWEAADVVSHDNGSVDARGPGDQGIRSVDGSTTSPEIGLVAACSARGLAGGLQELQPIQERRCGLAFLWAQTILYFGDVDAGRTQRMPVGQQAEKVGVDRLITAKMCDECRGIQQVAGQVACSVARVRRTQSAARRRVLQSG
jgi:hypothetical protein